MLYYFGHASLSDNFFTILGILLSILSGICSSLHTVTYGTVVGIIIEYASRNSSSKEENQEAGLQLMNGAQNFVLQNSGLALASFAFGFPAILLVNYGALKQVHTLRLLYFKKMLNQDMAWYDLNQTTDLASRMTTDLRKIEEALGDKMSTLLYLITQCTSCLVVILVMAGWELSLMCLASFFMAIVLVMVLAKASSKLTRKEMKAYANANSIAEEVFTFIKTVVAFGGQNKEKKRYDKVLDEIKEGNVKRAWLFAAYNAVTTMFMYITWGLTFWYGSKLIASDYKAEQLIMIYAGVTKIAQNLGVLQTFLEVFADARGAAEKIDRIINTVSDIGIGKGNGKKLDRVRGDIAFKNVNFSYPSRPTTAVLQGLSLEIKSGETVALVGSSGCGKSTCIQLIQRFYDPSSGEVYLDNTNLNELDLTWLRQQIGVVSQEPILFQGSVGENIKIGCPNITQNDIEKAAKQAHAHTFVSNLPQGYDTLVGERGVQLSGGQKQRIAIARALVRKPSILFLDEATSALDASSEAMVHAAMDLKNLGCTTIIAAHRLSTVKKADRVFVIVEGKVQEVGTHHELMQAKGAYYHLLNSQVNSAPSKSVELSSLEEASSRNGTVPKESFSPCDKVAPKASPSSCLAFVMEMIYPERRHTSMGCAMAIISGVILPVRAIITGAVIEGLAVLQTDTLQFYAGKLSLGFLVLGALKTLVLSLQVYSMTIASEMLSLRLRGKIFASILHQDVGWFDRKENGVGALCAQLSGGAVGLQGLLGSTMAVFLNVLFIDTFSLLVGIWFNWRLTLVCLCAFPLLVIPCYGVHRLIQKQIHSYHETLEKSLKLANEAVSGIRTIRSLTSENFFYEKYKAELIPYYLMAKKRAYIVALNNCVVRCFMLVVYLAPIYYGAMMLKDYDISLQSMFTSIEVMAFALWQIAYLLIYVPNIYGAHIAIKRVFLAINRMPIPLKDLETYSKNWEGGDVKCEELKFAYPTRPLIEALRGVDLTVLQGKTVALVGPSGCGKSTIMQLLLRFYDYSHGRITIDGENIKTMNLKHLRSHLGLVSQEPNLFNKTIAENIAYGDNKREIGEDEIIEASRKANIHTFVSALPLGYETKLGEKGGQLSGGQKQRLAIARALIREPKVLLLDEATSALDAENEKIVQEALDEARKGRSCIMIAHRLSTIQSADVICVINHGEIIEVGSHSELMDKKGFYYRLYTVHNIT